MKTIPIGDDQLEAGMDVTAWFPNGCGQGGTVHEVYDDKVLLLSGTAKVPNMIFHHEVDRWVREVPYDADECLNYSDECSGPVDMWYPGSGHKSWPRCTFHGEQRLANMSELERYADSDVVPDWFDPTYAGEHWDDDY